MYDVPTPSSNQREGQTAANSHIRDEGIQCAGFDLVLSEVQSILGKRYAGGRKESTLTVFVQKM